jgi:hypothetical protein
MLKLSVLDYNLGIKMRGLYDKIEHGVLGCFQYTWYVRVFRSNFQKGKASIVGHLRQYINEKNKRIIC